MPRRPLIVVAVGLATALPLVVTEGLSTGAVEPVRHVATAVQQVRDAQHLVTYRSARRHGQPVAVLRRATALRDAPGGRRLARLPLHTEFGTPTVVAAVGERGGWLRVISSQLPNGSRAWIPSSATSLIATPWRLRADLSQRLVTVYRGDRVVRQFPVAIGRPQTPTPTGRFAVTDKLSFIGGSSSYGCCALALTRPPDPHRAGLARRHSARDPRNERARLDRPGRELRLPARTGRGRALAGAGRVPRVGGGDRALTRSARWRQAFAVHLPVP